MKKNKQKMTMLEFCKLVLSKVSFDKELLKKEYQKSLRFLNPTDQVELKKWLNVNGKRLEILNVQL